MLLAILVGTGALFAIVALALDAGRQFLTHNQVQQAADSTVQGIISKCRFKDCPDQAVMFSVLNTTLATSTAQIVQACWDTGTRSETCINSAGTAVPRDTALFTAVCPTLRNYMGKTVVPAGVDPYFQIVVQTRTALSTLFNPGPAQHFRACGQGVWWTGASYNVPKVLLLPACQFGTFAGNGDTVTSDHYVYEDPGQGQSLTLGDCGAINLGNGYTETSTSTWLNEVGRMTADGDTCSGTDELNLSGEPSAANRVVKNKYCTIDQIRAFFNPPSPGANPRLFALAGPVVNGNAFIVAFANFTLVKIFDGNGKWLLPNGVETTPPALPGAPGSCTGKSEKLCMYGHFSAAVAAGHGGASSPGYAVRP